MTESQFFNLPFKEMAPKKEERILELEKQVLRLEDTCMLLAESNDKLHRILRKNADQSMFFDVILLGLAAAGLILTLI